MTSVTIDEIKRQQKEDIFCSEQREECQMVNIAGGQQARVKALQQLAVSEDSPFNLTSSADNRPTTGQQQQQLKHHHQQQQQQQVFLSDERQQQQLREVKARQLREETEEIKRQLELVKSHLNELNLFNGCSRNVKSCGDSQTTVPHDHVGAECRRVLTDAHACDATSSQGTQNTRQDRCNQANNIISHGQPVSGEWSTVARNTRRPPIEDFANDQQITSADSQFNRNTIANPPASGQHDTCGGGQQQQHQTAPKIFYDGDGAKRVSDTSSTRFRPLTGKTDCPNCACDRRRSVCDKCIRLQKDVVHQESDQQQEEQEQQQQQLQARQPTLLTEQRINNSGLNESNGALLTMAAKQQQQQQNKPSAHFRDYDERPIRPATKKLDDLLNEASSHKPIVMMKGRGAAPNASSGTTNEQVIVDQTVVPNKLYTIGKSLDDKRTKLAQAIEDLQIMMDKVKKRGDRLEQERKVAMLYRDQWKYGPTIGGGGLGGTSKSGSRESLRGSVGGQYQSRLDPNLARDSKSMMGFKHIEPELKLRQYNTSRAPALPSARGRQQFQQARAPKPKPRLSKMGTSSSNNKTSQVAFGSGNYQRSTQASVLHSRSKSLESLPRQRSTLTNGIRQQQHRPPPTNQTRTTVENLAKTNFHNGKSSSELDLSSPSKPSEEEESTPDHGVEEDLEEEIREDDMENGGPAHDEMRTNGAGNSLGVPGEENRAIHKDPSDSQADRPASNETRSRSGSRSPRSDDGQEHSRSPTNDEPEPGRRLSGWVPVFGETEIKTISKRPAERKVIILNGLAGGRTRDTTTGNAIANFRRPSEPIPSSSVGVGRSILRTGANMTMARPTTARASSLSGARGEDRVLNEAKKKLQFANNLLESEHLDSRTKNQVIVNRQQRARTTTTNQAQALRSKPTRDEAIAQQVLVRANNYSSKQMMSEQGSDQQRQPTKRRTRASSTSSADWQEENAQSLGDTSAAATTTNDTARSLIFSANKEISRLETMISEQQRLLLKLTSHDNQAMVTSCCQHHHHSVSRQPTEQPSASTSSQPTSSGGGVGRSHPTTGRQLISLLRDRLNKTKARLAKTLEEERAKHQQLDSSLRKQSDLENENELLKQSLSKCIDTCLRDISSTFESLSDHLSESASGIEAAAGGSGGSDLEVAFGGPTVQTAASPTPSGGTPLLANAAQLIADNSHLRRMRSHIDTIERQRRGIFEELNQEKHRSQQLELELKQSKLELEQLVEAKRHLEAQLAGTAQQANYSTSSEQVPSGGQGNTAGSVSQMNIAMKAKQDEPSSSSECHHQHQSESSARSTTTTPAAAPPIPSPTFRQQTTSARLDKPGPSSEQPLSDTDDPTTTTTSNSMTFSSIDLYRQYIQSMTPDLDAIRRERRMILDEFDNIKRMLSDMDT